MQFGKACFLKAYRGVRARCSAHGLLIARLPDAPLFAGDAHQSWMRCSRVLGWRACPVAGFVGSLSEADEESQFVLSFVTLASRSHGGRSGICKIGFECLSV